MTIEEVFVFAMAGMAVIVLLFMLAMLQLARAMRPKTDKPQRDGFWMRVCNR